MSAAAEKSYPSAGTILAGKYRVERALGEGGMAVVVEATHLTLGQRVAIKVLQGESGRAPEVLERFRREAQIAAQLPGEHIARVSDLGLTEQGDPFLVMELLVGRDLEAELRVHGRLPVPVAVDYILQACEGVAEAHAAGLVHRDLKPGNLFLTRRRDGTALIKVLDFGISKAAPGRGDMSLTKTQSNFGTPLYMSPEQIQSAKHVDARSDQHALAAILYALVTGRPPYDAESLTALAVVIATQPPRPARELVASVPAGLDGVLLRALSKRPADRFASLGELARALLPFGGPNAETSVRAIGMTLGQAETVEPVLGADTGPHRPIELGTIQPKAAYAAGPALSPPAAPAALAAPPMALQTAAAVSTAIRDRGPAGQRRALVLGLTGGLFLGGIALLMIVRAASKPPTPVTSNAEIQSAAAAGTDATGAAASAPPSAEPSVEPAPPASSATAAASTTSTASPSKSASPKTKSAAPSPKPKPKETDVWGQRR